MEILASTETSLNELRNNNRVVGFKQFFISNIPNLIKSKNIQKVLYGIINEDNNTMIIKHYIKNSYIVYRLQSENYYLNLFDLNCSYLLNNINIILEGYFP